MNSGGDAESAAVAIVGAGLSGLVCARALVGHGRRVRVFDKGRGVGGRMSTRRVNETHFDHGAQYFTVREPRFATAVGSWLEARLVASWTGRIVVLEGGEMTSTRGETERFVAVPAMNAVCRHLAADLDVSLETRVASLHREDGRWLLTDASGAGLGRFEAVVVTAPAPQTAELLAEAVPVVARRAAAARLAPCWAGLVAFDEPLELGFDGAFVRDSALSWIARHASKPERPAHEAWVLHASPEWATVHLEADRDEVAQRLFEAFRQAVDDLSQTPTFLAAHRWRYALPTEPLRETCLIDQELGVVACGDWCGGPRVEGAYLSGLAAADRLLGIA